MNARVWQDTQTALDAAIEAERFEEAAILQKQVRHQRRRLAASAPASQSHRGGAPQSMAAVAALVAMATSIASSVFAL